VEQVSKTAGGVLPGDDHYSVPGGVLEMSKKWSYFAAASLMVGYLLISHGAPMLAVVAGIAGVASYLRRTSAIT
jgi:hypothetical protein